MGDLRSDFSLFVEHGRTSDDAKAKLSFDVDSQSFSGRESAASGSSSQSCCLKCRHIRPKLQSTPSRHVRNGLLACRSHAAFHAAFSTVSVRRKVQTSFVSEFGSHKGTGVCVANPTCDRFSWTRPYRPRTGVLSRVSLAVCWQQTAPTSYVTPASASCCGSLTTGTERMAFCTLRVA